MKFIEMTTRHGSIVWFRADAIAAISCAGPHMHVWLDGINDEFVVNETPEQIMEMALWKPE